MQMIHKIFYLLINEHFINWANKHDWSLPGYNVIFATFSATAIASDTVTWLSSVSLANGKV